MSHRIDVELTSQREDGSWTWRAAGARQPKGVVDGGLVPDGTSPGDVVRAEAEMGVDGATIVAIKSSGGRERQEPERIELLGSGGDEGGVTTTLVKGRSRGRDWDDDGGDRRRGGRSRDGGRDAGRDGGRGDGPRGDRRRDGGGRDRDRRDGRGRDGRGRDGGDRNGRDRQGDRQRSPRETAPARPRAPRLRANQAHRKAFIAQLPAEQQPLARLVVRGGVPLVRDTLATQRKAAEEQGIPVVGAEPVLDVAEKLAPHARLAEWMDRADAALAQAETVDLRDLRSVVVAADGVARHEQTRELAEQLRAALATRVDTEQREWLADLGKLVSEGRAIAALRLSSRPPKAGSPLPQPLASGLATLAAGQLTADTAPDRYAAVVDALAFAPVRTQVVPEGVPANPTDALTTVIRKFADRVPQVAAAFNLSPAVAPPPRPPKPAVPPSDPGPAEGDTTQASSDSTPDT